MDQHKRRKSVPRKIAVFGDLQEQVTKSLAERNRVDVIRQSIGRKLFAIITSHVSEEVLKGHDYLGQFDLIHFDAKNLTQSNVLDALRKHKPAGVLMKLTSPPAELRDEIVGAAVLESGVSALSTCSVGTDHLNMPQLTRLKIPVFHTPDVLTESVAVHTLSMIMALTSNLFKADRYVRNEQWTALGSRAAHSNLICPDLFTWTIGIVGMGRIGTEVLNHLATYGPNVVWTDPNAKVRARADDVEQQYCNLASQRGHKPTVQWASLDKLLSQSDLVTIHTDLNTTSRHVLNEQNLSKIKPGAYLVNTSRGGVADYDALYHHLASGRLGGAGLDVFAHEPMSTEDLRRLTELPNVILTPHVASNRIQTRLSMSYLSCYALMASLLGYSPTCIANPEVYK